jgi:hypothetical protein
VLQLFLRARRYNALHADPRISSRTDFFAAAALVTCAIGRLGPCRFLWRLSSVLEQANLQRAAAIRSGSLYAHGTVGHNTEDFIRVEQSLVQMQLECLRIGDAGQYVRVIATVDRGLARLAPGRATRWIDPRFANAVSFAQREAGKPDFASQAFRELVGRHVAAQVSSGARS